MQPKCQCAAEQYENLCQITGHEKSKEAETEEERVTFLNSIAKWTDITGGTHQKC